MQLLALLFFFLALFLYQLQHNIPEDEASTKLVYPDEI